MCTSGIQALCFFLCPALLLDEMVQAYSISVIRAGKVKWLFAVRGQSERERAGQYHNTSLWWCLVHRKAQRWKGWMDHPSVVLRPCPQPLGTFSKGL